MKSRLAWGLALAALAVLVAEWVANADAVLAYARDLAGSWKVYAQAYPAVCWLGLLAFGTLAINCPVPLAALLKVLSGFFFGLTAGFALNVSMSVAGGLAGFMATRHLFHHALYSRFSHHLARVNLDIARNGFWYVLSARLLMATPFFLVNVLAGLSCIRKRKFLLGTFLGVFPSSFIYAESGRQLASFTSMSDLASPKAVLVMALLAAVSVLPAIVRRKKSHGR